MGIFNIINQNWKFHYGDVPEADYMGYVLNYYLDDGSLRQSEKKYKNYS